MRPVGGTIVLNASYEVLTSVSWQRAVCLMLTTDDTGLPVAELVEADDELMVRSQHIEIARPRVIRLTRYVYVKFTDRRLAKAGRVTNRGVLQRDNWTCVFCAGKATTIDHVLPRSRGGEDIWENLAAACQPCNNRKDNKTPEEAGMKLLWHPYAPDPTAVAQRQVWKTLAA